MRKGDVMKKIVILTGSELRHDFVRKFIANNSNISVLRSYCEGVETSLRNLVKKEDGNTMRIKHLIAREQSEKDFFDLYVKTVEDKSNPLYLPMGEINSSVHVKKIVELNPDLVVAYGCSIIKGQLLSVFMGRFLNVHLGLSPYYRGSGTNYWPLVNEEPEYIGVTFMHIDAGIDTGEIIHQIRPRIEWGDTPSSIGNRLIVDMAEVYSRLIVKSESLLKMPQPAKSSNDKIYRQRDYSEDSVRKLYDLFKNGIVENYLDRREERCRKVPIVSNPSL